MTYNASHFRRLRKQYWLDMYTSHIRRKGGDLKDKCFTFDGIEYRYFVHPYNHTWKNERSVEIPIVLRQVESSSASTVLEVGNVLRHYVRNTHLVVDRYEKASKGPLLRMDIMDYAPQRRFRLLISISTIEHIGRDEIPRDPTKAIRCLTHLTSLIEPCGKIIITVPVGYNPVLDSELVHERSDWDVSGLCVHNGSTEWIECSKHDALSFPYDFLAGCAKSVLVAQYPSKLRETPNEKL